ncbi:hypothetical protein HKCCE3408_14725 [Rhodobacterales bacterium HKCCE3408]|nr:hypothetical protein [Rhodobacterales bacterium HKCCE3408]
MGLTLAGLSVLRHGDYEIVVSDNSDDDTSSVNQKTAAETLENVPHRYVRPERVLGMSDHWKFAVSQAKGNFIGITTDRMTLLPDSLSIIDAAIAERQSTCICFPALSLTPGVKNLNSLMPKTPIEIETVNSRDILEKFARGSLTKRCPRFLNSFTSSSLLFEIDQRFGGIFDGISPDYAFLFRLLETSPVFDHLEAPILIDHSPHVSNGVAWTRNVPNKASQDFGRRLLEGHETLLRFGPIPYDVRLLPNVIREHEIARSRAHDNIPALEIQSASFTAACHKAVRRFAMFDEATKSTFLRIRQFELQHGISRQKLETKLRLRFAQIRNTVKRRFAFANRSGDESLNPSQLKKMLLTTKLLGPSGRANRTLAEPAG